MPRYFFFSIAFSVAACVSPVLDSDSTAKIVGGEVEDGFPAVGWITRDGVRECTGTLIDSRRVISAAHCFIGQRYAAVAGPVDASRFTFSMGPNEFEPTGTFVPSAVEVHPRALEDAISFDVAVMVFAEPISRLRGFSPSPNPVAVDDTGLVLGFGRTSDSDPGGVKRSVQISVSSIAESYWRYEGASGICDGDSGGPVVALNEQGTSYEIIGIANGSGISCDGSSRRQVFARLDVVTDFLSSTEP